MQAFEQNLHCDALHLMINDAHVTDSKQKHDLFFPTVHYGHTYRPEGFHNTLHSLGSSLRIVQYSGSTLSLSEKSPIARMEDGPAQIYGDLVMSQK